MRVERIAACRPAGIILREKDLSPEAYKELARQVLSVCRRYGVPCILHSFWETAEELGADAVHLPLPALRAMEEKEREKCAALGASCHSVEDALEARRLGCSYITAGHIFATDCKKGLPGRGLPFLEAVCQAAGIPALAIGGISEANAALVRGTGAAGLCLMSSLMETEDPEGLLEAMKK